MSTDAATAQEIQPLAPLAGPRSPLDDFSDRLSPMVVKELRQGLRAKTFVIVFLTLQGLLALILLSAAAAAAHDRAGVVISRIIFLFFSLAVLVIQPLRGVGALSSEMKGNTIDLMVLTRLSSWRIVTGKWVSLVSQSALLFAAIIPYLILRYFFGSMNLFAELVALGCVFLGSALLTAVMVGLSACGSLLVRGILPVFGTPALVAAIFGITLSRALESTIEFFTFAEPWSGVTFLTCLGIAAFLTWAALDFGASQICPMSENRAILRRLVTIACTVALAALGFWFDTGWIVVGLVTILTPALAVALTEPHELVPVVTEPFARRGLLGRMVGRFLYPCWPSAALFCAVVVLIALGQALGLANLDSEETVLLVAWLGTMLFPAFWLILFRRKVQNPFSTYMLTLAASLVLMFIAVLLGEAIDDEAVAWMFCWLPPAHVVMLNAGGISDDVALGIASVAAVLYGIVVMLAALVRFPSILEAETQALTNQGPAANPASGDEADAAAAPESPVAANETDAP